MKVEVFSTLFITLISGQCFGDLTSWRKRNEERTNSGQDKCTYSSSSDDSFEVECIRGGTGEKEQEEMSFTTSSPIIRAQVLPGEYAKIHCADFTQWKDLGLIAGLGIGNCPLVWFFLCPLPASNESSSDHSFQQFFNSIGAQNVSTLKFRSDLTLNDTLSAKQLEGMNGLKKLYLSNNGLTTLPEDLFSGVPDVGLIDLSGNNIILPSSIFKGLTHLEVLELGSNGITSLPPLIFRGLSQLRLLNIWQNKLGESTLSRSHFRGLSSLESLDLNNNSLKMLNPDIFDDLVSLNTLNLSYNNFTSLPAELFIKNMHLEKLRLNYNRVPFHTLHPGLFSNLTSLRELSLESCGLEFLLKDLFEGSVNLIKISFRKNKLKSIPEALFSGWRQVKTIDLSENLLTSLHDSLFKGLKTLKIIDLKKNRLDALPETIFYDLSSLEELDLSSNNLKDIPFKMFSRCLNLRKLSLSHNQLSFPNPFGDSSWNSPLHRCVNLQELEIANNSLDVIFEDWRWNMLSLNKLNLSDNEITNISANDLQFISDRVNFDLSKNKISIIDLKAAETIAKAQSSPSKKNVFVTLDSNPLNCNCGVYYLLRYIEGRMAPQVRDLFNLKIDHLSCQSPEHLLDKSVKSLNSYSLTCDADIASLTAEDEMKLKTHPNSTEVLDFVKEKCPRYCQCLYHPENNSLIVNCSGTNLTALPLVLPVFNQTSYTELQAEGLGLQKLWAPASLPLGYDRVKVLKLGRNFLTQIDVHSLPPHLSVLELHENNLTHLSKDVIVAVSNASKITLHDNPWSCDCEAMDLLNFVQEHFKQVILLSNVTCGSGDHSMKAFSQLTVNDICPLPTAIIVATCTSVAVIGIVLGTLAALYYRHQHVIKVWLYAHNLCLWLITEEELDKDKQYDAFISYSHQDEDFVVGQLVPGLEGGPISAKSTSDNGVAHAPGPEGKNDTATYKLCLHFRDWVAGEWIPAQIARSVESSCRTVVVLSPAFLESVWGQMEFRAAHCRALSEGRTRVIVILYGDVPPAESLDPELRTYLTTNTYLKWGDPWFWQKLRYAMPHLPRKTYKKVPSSASILDMNLKNVQNGNGHCSPLELKPTNHVPTDDSTTKIT